MCHGDYNEIGFLNFGLFRQILAYFGRLKFILAAYFLPLWPAQCAPPL